MTKEVMKQALDALKNTTPFGFDMKTDKRFYSAIEALEEALKQEQGEPVGKFAKFTDGIWREVTDGSAGVPLYTHPKGCDECGVGGGYALYCLPCVEKFVGTKEIVKIDWDAVHEKLIEVWHRDISADEALDEIKYLIKPIEDKLKEKNIE